MAFCIWTARIWPASRGFLEAELGRFVGGIGLVLAVDGRGFLILIIS